MITKHLLSQLRLVHAAYNFSVFLVFLYHAQLGLAIRRARRAKAPLPFPLIKKHRKQGPVLVLLGMLGFFIGFTLVIIDRGNVLAYPAHFGVGCAIVLLLLTTYILTRFIKGQDSPYRTPHFIIGILILCLYLMEVLLGLGILL